MTAPRSGPPETEFFERAGTKDTKVGSGPEDDPADVAREGFEALMKGDDEVVTGSAGNKAKAAQQANTAEPGSGAKTDEEERQEIRGEQGTSSGDPHDDTDPQSG
ncbi:hypothetical protein BS329_09460 [Amycolatopsis coloradensis]|uniref:Uncharacterized protein n=1 Tax=Amycolatopsis coloradensis TaxID=76021 RepID=A0A1R0KZC3_9PSEU|nr:hypothetical protein [Amycolatopsis coloradensis]OLZ54711.1 hypothetical protein BS329_09460 [Amycolatopsis coloradensis]